MQDSDASPHIKRSTGTTFVSHLPKRWFSVVLSAALSAAFVTLPATAAAQDANPLDRADEPVDPDPAPVQPVHQPSPRAPQHAPPANPHHHPPPPRDHYHRPPPPRGPEVVGYDEVTEPRYGLVIAGSVLLGVAYVVPVSILAVAEFPNSTEWAAIPVVGPWMTIGRMRYGSCSNRRVVEDDCDDDGERAGDVVGAVALGFTGVMQAAGLTMLVVGASAQKTSVKPVYGFAPMPVRNGMGLSMTGSF